MLKRGQQRNKEKKRKQGKVVCVCDRERERERAEHENDKVAYFKHRRENSDEMRGSGTVIACNFKGF